MAGPDLPEIPLIYSFIVTYIHNIHQHSFTTAPQREAVVEAEVPANLHFLRRETESMMRNTALEQP